MDEHKRIKDLTDRALRDPEGQEGRSCAVLALQQLSKGSMLPWQKPAEPDPKQALDPPTKQVGEDTYVLLTASRYWSTCKACGMPIAKGAPCYWSAGRGAFHPACLRE